MSNTFERLRNINLKDKTKEKIGLKYLSWAYAWDELKKVYPDAKRNVYKRLVKTELTKSFTNSDGTVETSKVEYENEVAYFTDGRTCTVKVGVEIEGVEYIEELPVMDNKNRAIRLEAVTSVDVNRAIQRAFVKACAWHGLGLYIYAGEDLPEADKVVINYDELKSGIKYTPIDAETFNKLQAETIEMIQASNELDSTISEQIYQTIKELFPTKRISLLTFTEDAENLFKLHTFLTRLFAVVKK